MTWTIRIKICAADDPECKNPQIRDIVGGLAKPEPEQVEREARLYAADYNMRVCEILNLTKDPTFIEEHGTTMIGVIGTIILIAAML
jgi:hypothetical protein